MRDFTLFAIFFVPCLFSAPIGNPSLPSLLQEGFFVPDKCWSNPQFGAAGDYLIQKRFRPCRHSNALDVQKASLWGASEMGMATWSIRERFNLQLELGSGQFHWQWQQADRNILGRAKGGLIWSGDAKLIVLEVKETSFALDGHAGGWDWMSGSASSNGSSLAQAADTSLRYWQVGVAVTQKISLFAPYLGLALNRTRLKVSGLSTGTGRMHARHVAGPFGGCSIGNGSRLLVNLEWRGWFEEGLSASAQVRF